MTLEPFKKVRYRIARTISQLAAKAMCKLPKASLAYKEARLRRAKPMDYLRCVELPLAYQQLKLIDGMKVLDVASPQWFSLFLAHQFPKVHFFYTNILQSEIDQINDTAQCLGLRNIQYSIQDGRSLNFQDNTFDYATSLSAIEHIAPDVGGDVLALKEIRRVLTSGGTLTLSLPLKDERSLVYDNDHPVWERGVQTDNFYMRNYDPEQFEELAKNTDFLVTNKKFMYERIGLFAMEYWECEGKNRKEKDGVIKLKKKIDKLMGYRLEAFLASRYIHLERHSKSDRLINLVASLTKKEGYG